MDEISILAVIFVIFHMAFINCRLEIFVTKKLI